MGVYAKECQVHPLGAVFAVYSMVLIASSSIKRRMLHQGGQELQTSRV